MKQVSPRQSSPLHCASRRMKRSLKPGHAPSCWKKQVQRSTARTMAWHKFCAWAEREARQQPKLNQQPLFGSCLAELTGLETRKGDTENREAPPVAAPVRWPWQGRNRAEMPGSHASDPGQPTEAGGLPGVPGRKTKEGALAPRLESARPQGLPPAASRRLSRSELARLGRERSLPKPGSGTFRRKVQPGSRRKPLPGSGPLHTWFAVARARMLRVTEVSRSMRARREATGGWVASPVPTPPAWQIELNGPSASLELLARLAGVPAGEVLDIANAASPGARPGGVPRRPASGPARSGGDRQVEPTPGLDLGSRLPGGRIVRQTLGSRLQGDGIAPPTVTGSEFTSLAPPADTVSLPALSPPQKPYDPTLPVAAATLQYGARREPVDTAPEDLDALAARIKRILDEEARRHGIDV